MEKRVSFFHSFFLSSFQSIGQMNCWLSNESTKMVKKPNHLFRRWRVFIYRSGAFDIPIGPISVSLLPSLYTIRFAKKKNNINIHENVFHFVIPLRITSFRTRPRRYAITLRYSLDARETCKIYLNAKIYSFCGFWWWRKGREPRRRNKNKSTPILFVYSIVSSSSYLLLGERSLNNK